MRQKTAGIALAVWVALHIGMVVGSVGREGGAYTIGLSHVLSLAFIMVSTAALAFFAGRKG